ALQPGHAPVDDDAAALRLTAQDLHQLKLIDDVIPEPLGGAHRNKEEAIASVGRTIEGALADLIPWDGASLIQKRRNKFLAFGRSL
ncbi:MAG TPA: acetyl-CoA carboxylase carboxyl transferase subunit alpha, partial [Alphaproteobacteria bacterium]|nr:acetyl-CoA carboxylase carboxyl transferase subunit alpha [Alphaproteobacteria bacterium]